MNEENLIFLFVKLINIIIICYCSSRYSQWPVTRNVFPLLNSFSLPNRNPILDFRYFPNHSFWYFSNSRRKTSEKNPVFCENVFKI